MIFRATFLPRTARRLRRVELAGLAGLALVIFLAAVAPAARATKPPAVAPAVLFAAIGDMGTGDEGQLAVARAMTAARARTPFDFVLMLGDNIYEKEIGRAHV